MLTTPGTANVKKPQLNSTLGGVTAFFENCWEARIGIIDRLDFEAQLQAHFHNETSSQHDYAQLALRNVVFAAGYRAILAKGSTVPFAAAQTHAWHRYFKNALSVLTELLLSPPRLMTVQALALMVRRSPSISPAGEL